MNFTAIIFTILLSSTNAFKHYQINKLTSINGCPLKQKNKQNKKNNVLITYPSWKPKEKFYNPRKVDWSSVISGCHAACNFDKRLCNFYIRAAAHDSLSISEGYGGTDGSMLITEDELNRPENKYDNFGYILSKNALALAKRFDASVADIISVCGAYSVKYLGGIDIIKTSNKNDPFLVGRLDSTTPNPAHQLVPENADTNQFNSFAIKYNFTLEEFSALLGSHALIDNKECLNNDNTYCDPINQKCDKLSMFTWINSYYNDICAKNISMSFNTQPIKFIKTKKQFIHNELCKYTSNEFQTNAKNEIKSELELDVETILLQTNDLAQNDLLLETEGEFSVPIDIVSYENNIPKNWIYTTNDAWLGLACQNKLELNNINTQIQLSMNKFKNFNNEWNKVYSSAYKKMINNNVRWFKLKYNGIIINGNECNSGYKYINKIKLCKSAFLPSDKFYY